MAEKAKTKIIEVIAKGIGKVYEPFHKKRMAKATAYEIDTVADAMKRNSALPIKYDSNGITIDTSDYEGLVERTGNRLAYQEINKQENLEAVMGKALLEAGDVESDSEESISREWINRFIDMASEISTEEMQNIWAKVLAGEVIEPNSFSIKTLECLRCLSKKDAEMFARLCKFVLDGQLVFAEDDLIKKYNISYEELFELHEDGLIRAEGMIQLTHHLESMDSELFLDFGNYVLLVAKMLEDRPSEFSISQFPLTRAGKELYTIACSSYPDDQYVFDVVKKIKELNPGFTFSLRKVIRRDGKTPVYGDEDIDVQPDEVPTRT